MRWCDACGLPIEISRLTSSEFVIHMPSNTKEVLRALQCPAFGAQTIPAIAEKEPDIPALWQTTGHWNAVWKRSP